MLTSALSSGRMQRITVILNAHGRREDEMSASKDLSRSREDENNNFSCEYGYDAIGILVISSGNLQLLSEYRVVKVPIHQLNGLHFPFA